MGTRDEYDPGVLDDETPTRGCAREVRMGGSDLVRNVRVGLALPTVSTPPFARQASRPPCSDQDLPAGPNRCKYGTLQE